MEVEDVSIGVGSRFFVRKVTDEVMADRLAEFVRNGHKLAVHLGLLAWVVADNCFANDLTGFVDNGHELTFGLPSSTKSTHYFLADDVA